MRKQYVAVDDAFRRAEEQEGIEGAAAALREARKSKKLWKVHKQED